MEKIEIFVVSSTAQPLESDENLWKNILCTSEGLPSLVGESLNCKSKIWFLSSETGSAFESSGDNLSLKTVWNSLKKGVKTVPTFGVISNGFRKIYGTLNHPGKTVVNIHIWKWQNERENRDLTESLSPFVHIYCAKVIFYSEDFQVYLIPPDVPSSVVILPLEKYEPENPAWRGQIALYSQNAKTYEFVKYVEISPWNESVHVGDSSQSEEPEPLYFGDKLELVNQCDFRTIPATMFTGHIYCLRSSCDIKGRHAEDARDFFTYANAEGYRSFILRLIYSLDLPLAWRENLQGLRSIGRITRHVSFASFSLEENSNRRLLLFRLKNVEDLEGDQESENLKLAEHMVSESLENNSLSSTVPSVSLKTLLQLVQLRKNVDLANRDLLLSVLKSYAKEFHAASQPGEDDPEEKPPRAIWPSCETLEKRNRQLAQLYSCSSQGDSRVFSISTAEVVRIFKDPSSPSKKRLRPNRTVKKPISDDAAKALKWPEVYSKRLRSFGICYSQGKESEQRELECWRLQEKLEAQETESSCNPLDSGFRCFVLRRNREANGGSNTEVSGNHKSDPASGLSGKKLTSPQQLRRSPRKRRLSGEEVEQEPPRKRTTESVPQEKPKELSKAEKNNQLKEDFPRVIYKCLIKRGIGTKDPLYRQCGKHLFAALKNFAREEIDGDTSSHRLLEVCEKAVDGILEQCKKQKKK